MMDNYNHKSLMEKVVIANENSRKRHFEKEISIMIVMLSNSQISMKKRYFKREKPYFKREKTKKGTKHQRTEKHDIKGVDTKVKYQVCKIRIIEITNEREDIEAQ